MKSLFEQTDKIRQQGRRWRKIRNIIFLVLVFGFFCWGGIQYYYPYSTGIVTGKIDKIVYQGQVFKTYEGKLNLSDKQSSMNSGIKSDDFEFSISKKSIADKLTYAGDKIVALHYTEYFKAIPWRGCSRYVVDDIVSITADKEDETAGNPVVIKP